MYDSGVTQSDSSAFASVEGQIGPALVKMLCEPEIQPGASPGYQLCKIIYSYHPLGSVLTDAPIRRAQAKPREIAVPGLAEERVAARYVETWNALGRVGGTVIMHNLMSASRIYGIASLAVGEVGKDPASPLDIARIADADLYFNILDPLNTAGSLVLNQDPNSPNFLKPSGPIHVNGQHWHPSRLFVKLNEQPLYIDWTASAFGFVGRSVYQRCLYPLKSFVQSMITDQYVVQKVGLIIYKAQSPGSFIDNVMQTFFGAKRSAIKQGITGQVLSIGIEEALESLNLQNLDKAFSTVRQNILRNIASATGMPASIIAQETLVEGFGEGSEDANKEIEFLEFIRTDMEPAYQFLDTICRRKAWTASFYETLTTEYRDLAQMGFERALHEWIRNFKATWPNLKMEPDSEKVKTEDVQLKAVVALAEILLPEADPETKAKVVAWVADNVNARENLFAGHLDIDEETLKGYYEETKDLEAEQAQELANGKPREPRPFSAAS